MSMRARLLALAFLVIAGGLPASAETIGYGDAMGVLIGACGADIEANCADVRLGGGRIEACLQENASRLSPGCVSTYNVVAEQLQLRAAAQEAMRGPATSAIRQPTKRYFAQSAVSPGEILQSLTGAGGAAETVSIDVNAIRADIEQRIQVEGTDNAASPPPALQALATLPNLTLVIEYLEAARRGVGQMTVSPAA